MICKKCGNDMGDDYKGKYCTSCGKPLDYVVISDGSDDEVDEDNQPQYVLDRSKKSSRNIDKADDDDELLQSDIAPDVKSHKEGRKKLKLSRSYSTLVLVAGIVGLCFSCVFIGIIPANIALVLGILELIAHGKNSKTIIGIICSTLAIIIFVLALIFATGLGNQEDDTSYITIEQIQNLEETVPETNVIEDYELDY